MVGDAKKKLICMVAFSAFAVTAHAQSSVTLYGLLDEGIMYQSNVSGGKRVSLESLGGMNGSRWGLTGSEDLGGGLHAIFTLESGINLNNGQFGQGGTAFGRQAFVGLASDHWGSVTLGRQYDMMLYFLDPVSMAGSLGSVLFAHPGDLDNMANSMRVNNVIRYMSPDYHGFSFGGEYSVGGVPGNTTANSGYFVGAGYKNGGLALGAAYEYFKNPSSTTAGSGLFTDNANGASGLGFSLNSGYRTANAYQVAAVSAAYTMGPVTVSTSFSNTQYANMGGTLLGQTARFNDVEAGVKYWYGPALFFALDYNYLIGKGVRTTAGETIGNQHYNQLAIVGDYFLSKRTDLYLGAGYQRASGTSSTGAPAVANFTQQGDSSNNHQFLVRADIRHRF
jgi:predicted porin